MAELDTLDPVPEQVKLVSGTFVDIEDLKARQFFRLLRILTHGAIPGLGDLFSVNSETDPQQFAANLLTVTLLSIPDAEDETVAFIASMVKPTGLIEGRRLNKQDAERNAELWNSLAVELENPELDDLVTIVEAIVRRESADILALGKRLAAMFKLAEKTGQTKPQSSPSPTSPAGNSSADSAAPSTSSRPSTDGPTSTSETSASGDSASASQPSGSAASTSSGAESSG